MSKKSLIYTLVCVGIISGVLYFLIHGNFVQVNVSRDTKDSAQTISGVKIKTVSTKNSFDWNKEIKNMFPDSCGPSIMNVPLHGLNDTPTKHSISFPAYVCGDPDYGFASSTQWLAGDGVLKYTNYYDEKEGPAWDDKASVASFGYYWFLDGKQPEEIISAIINALPTSEQRQYCFIEKNTSDGTFVINYEKELESYVPEGDPLWGVCGEFGVSNGQQIFKQVGDVLLFLYLGQDVPPYDYQNITSK